MARSGVVKKSFPYSADGITVQMLAVGHTLYFPDELFDGLEAAGFVGEGSEEAVGLDGAKARDGLGNSLNDRFIAAFDAHLQRLSDDELKSIIARSGTEWSGSLVRADLVRAAKQRMVEEAERGPVSLSAAPSVNPAAQDGSADPGQPNLSAMKVDDLKALAAERGIDISQAANKADIIAVIEAAAKTAA